MDLWIRTQDKKQLLKVNSIIIKQGTSIDVDKKLAYFIFSDDILIAAYMGEKRALEVLDEIHELLKPNVFINTFNIEKRDLLCTNTIETIITPKINEFSISQFNNYVYEMPKE